MIDIELPKYGGMVYRHVPQIKTLNQRSSQELSMQDTDNCARMILSNSLTFFSFRNE